MDLNLIESGGFMVADKMYAIFLRELLKKAIDDPDHVYDDRVLAAMDGLFAYKDED